jgi:hypothetical protein
MTIAGMLGSGALAGWQMDDCTGCSDSITLTTSIWVIATFNRRARSWRANSTIANLDWGRIVAEGVDKGEAARVGGGVTSCVGSGESTDVGGAPENALHAVSRIIRLKSRKTTTLGVTPSQARSIALA